MFKQFYKRLEELKSRGQFPDRYLALMKSCYENYRLAAFTSEEFCEPIEKLFCTYLDLVERQIDNPFKFKPFHKKVTNPINYQQFSIDFMQPLIVMEQSTLKGDENLKTIEQFISSENNVILLANHQTEPDPQIIFALLTKKYPNLAENMIFIAGDRVVTDPMAVPFSMGCNLICIYSKKHIDNPPELKEEKLKHNQKTMKILKELLSEGGKCIYVAPSGGRDRPNTQNVVEVAPFDAASIEMLHLMSKQAEKPTHFFPLALSTYNILPPPNSVEVELGEDRKTKRAPAHLNFGNQIDMNSFPGSDEPNKKLRREKRAFYIWSLVQNLYNSI